MRERVSIGFGPRVNTLKMPDQSAVADGRVLS